MAEQGKLIVATGRTNDGVPIYTGHLLFGGSFPHGRIIQIHVDEAHRRNGVGRQLVQALVRRAQAQQYLSLRARVASDLQEANAFYERLGFHHIQTERGGSARQRTINIRVRELDTPHLFGWGAPEAGAGVPDVRLPARTRPEGARYVIDLNVLFDVLKRRAKSDAAGWIVSAGLNNVVRLAVTEELIVELQRTSQSAQGTPDPILEIARKLPRIARPPESDIFKLSAHLGKIIFPDRTAQGRLTDQDRSDLIHLVTSIYHQVAGFITSEKAILRASGELRATYAINIIGPDEFAAATEPITTTAVSNFTAEVAGTLIRVEAVNDARDRGELLTFLERMFVPVQERGELLSSGATGAPVRRLAVRSGEELVAVCSYQLPNEVRCDTDLFLCGDQDHPSAALAIDHLLDRVCREVTQNGPALVRLRQFLGHVLTREIATARGFHAGSGTDRFATLQKGCVGGPIGPDRWNEAVKDLEARIGLSLPKRMPTYEGPMQLVPIQIDRQALDVPLQHLEAFLSPVMLLLTGRDGVMVPIRRRFADLLFGASPQMSFLAGPEAVLLHERTYFSDTRTERIIRPGMPILFYESGKGDGRAAVIAMARVNRTETVLKEEVTGELRRRGLLTHASLTRMGRDPYLLATTFDNIMLFRNPVPLSRLRAMNCVDGANLVTARRISSAQVERLAEAGSAHA